MDKTSTTELLTERQAAFRIASELVDPIIEMHGLEQYRDGAMFSHMSTFTEVDQHVSHILNVARWLLGNE